MFQLLTNLMTVVSQSSTLTTFVQVSPI